MTVLTLLLYYSLAIALVGSAILLALRCNKRERDAADARHEDDLRRWRDSTPPLAPWPPPDVEPDDEPEPDLSAAVLQPIAPLLMRVAREYLDKPHDRERLLRSLTQALSTPATSSPAP